MLDFPRLQFFLTSIISLVLFLLITKRWKWYDYTFLIGFIAALGVQSHYLINYTYMVGTKIPTAEQGKFSTNDQISLLITNVKMTNHDPKLLLKLIESKKPDLILAMEIDSWWTDHLKSIEDNYPYAQKTINEVTYGMVLYSKYPLENIQVNYFQNEHVPSFEGQITLKNGKQFNIFTVHPVPPSHFEDLPDNVGQDEMAMIKLGAKVQKKKLPTLVAGDLNDVVWSDTDKLTGTHNILHDVRVGRGFYNSYNAKNIFMRWPLDHIFLTKEFQLIKLERLPSIGSDHFPIYAEIML